VFVPLGERALARSGLSPAIVSAAEGTYSRAQFLLDITQGARVSSAAYPRPAPGPLALAAAGGAGTIHGWAAAAARAEAAPADLRPGLLAGALGGAGYVGTSAGHADAPAAATPGGAVAAVSLGTRASLLARISAMRRRERLVVADLPGGARGAADLAALARDRAPGELLIALQRVPAGGGELLWGAAAGLPGERGRDGRASELESASTEQPGLIASIDVAPTILAALGVRALPAGLVGRPLRTAGTLHGGALRALLARLQAIPGRRLTALAVLLGGWALLLGAGALAGSRAGAFALRAGAIGVLWTPTVALAPAALDPSAPLEYALIALGCLGLGGLTVATLRWPLAPLAPALAALLALAFDALAGAQLLMRSLLGPDPAGGARFYGAGNELKAALAVLVLAAVAAALYPARRGTRAAAAFAGAGALVAALEGAPLLGASVGGAILVCAGFALAAAMMLPGAARRRCVAAALLSPVLALALLAGLELVAGRGAYYYGSVLHARSPAQLSALLERRYRSAWEALAEPAMALATVLCVLAAAFALRLRTRLLAPLRGDPGFAAAFAGGLLAGLVGALVEDSGPLLLIEATLALACVACYVLAPPASAPAPATPRERAPRPMLRPASADSELVASANATIAVLGGSEGTA
jgi:hypothetical protein